MNDDKAKMLYERARDRRGRAEDPGQLGYGMSPWEDCSDQNEWREYADELCFQPVGEGVYCGLRSGHHQRCSDLSVIETDIN